MSTDNETNPETPTPTTESEVTAGELPQATDDDSPTGREIRYRRELREAQATGAGLVQQVADTAARWRSAERRLVDLHLAGRIRDTEPFWASVDHGDLLDDAGDVDLGRVDQQLAGVLEVKPYLAPADPRVPLVAPAATVSSVRAPGYDRIVGAVNGPAIEEQATWTGVLRQAAEG